jgi:enterochelin esterase-like enzyme
MQDNPRLTIIEDFKSNILKNKRNLYVYLPTSYDSETDKKYPVLYMHDGKHVFFADTSGESWDVHTTVDRLSAEGKIQEIIVVGIANIPEQRLIEYFHDNPHIRDSFQVTSSGELYEDFIIQEIKPYVDSNYRTMSDPDNTAIMGSSAGGLVSYNIGFCNPHIFGKIGILSPYFVKASMVNNTLEEIKLYQLYEPKPPLQVWLDMGGAEGFIMAKHARDAADSWIQQGFKSGEDLMYYLDMEAGHSQKDWAKRIHAPLIYFFGTVGSPQSVVLTGEQIVGIQGPQVQLNPIITYDSGFFRSALTGIYEVEHPSLLEASSEGILLAKQQGTTNISFIYEGLRASIQVTVVKQLSEFVTVAVEVNAPVNTPNDATLYAGINLQKTDDRIYKGKLQLPRGLSFQFKISRGFGLHEKNLDGTIIKNKTFKTSQNLDLKYIVEAWEDL